MKLRSRTTRLFSLPSEIFAEILSYLDKKDLKNVRGVSKVFFDAATPRLFRELLLTAEALQSLLHTRRPSVGTHNFLQPKTARQVLEVVVQIYVRDEDDYTMAEHDSGLALLRSKCETDDARRPSRPLSAEASARAFLRNVVSEFAPKALSFVFSRDSPQITCKSQVPLVGLQQLLLRVPSDVKMALFLESIDDTRVELAFVLRSMFLHSKKTTFPLSMQLSECDLHDADDSFVGILANMSSTCLSVRHSSLSRHFWKRSETFPFWGLDLHVYEHQDLGLPVQDILRLHAPTVGYLALGCPLSDDDLYEWPIRSSYKMKRLEALTVRDYLLLAPCLELWHLPVIKDLSLTLSGRPWRSETIVDRAESSARLFCEAFERNTLQTLDKIVFSALSNQLEEMKEARHSKPYLQKLHDICEVRGKQFTMEVL